MDKTTCKVFAIAPQFVSPPQGKILSFFQNQFWLLNLYKLRHFKSCDSMYQDQIIIEDGTL